MKSDLFRAAIAEFIAIFSLVSVGCGTIIVNNLTGTLGHLGVALAFGLVVMVMIGATGHISGAHLNPAVTLAFAITRNFPWKRVPVYLGAQLLGAFLAAFLLRILFGEIGNLGVTLPAGSQSQAFLLEMLITAALIFVIMAVATDTKAIGKLAAIMIGARVPVNALWAGPITGASMNPARSLGPAIVAGIWEEQWIYLAAPLLGAALGALAYQLIRE